MKLGLAFAALAAVLRPTAAMGQQIAQVRRGDIHITVNVHGTVVTQNVATLTSTIPGEVEDLNFQSTGTWAVNGSSLGTVASERLAALLDSPTTTDRSVVLSRWSSEFPLVPIRCPDDCYILKISVHPGEWITPEQALFTTAQLRLTGIVSAGDARLIRDGQWLTYWAKGRPEHKFLMRVDDFTLDNPGQPESSAGTFAMDLGAQQYLPPGTPWEGFIIPVDHPDALLVPTLSLIEFQGQIFLPLPVSTGITTADWTEISAGVSVNEPYLLLNNAQLDNAVRYQLQEPPAISTAAPTSQAQTAAPAQNAPTDEEPDYGGDIYTQ